MSLDAAVQPAGGRAVSVEIEVCHCDGFVHVGMRKAAGANPLWSREDFLTVTPGLCSRNPSAHPLSDSAGRSHSCQPGGVAFLALF